MCQCGNRDARFRERGEFPIEFVKKLTSVVSAAHNVLRFTNSRACGYSQAKSAVQVESESELARCPSLLRRNARAAQAQCSSSPTPTASIPAACHVGTSTRAASFRSSSSNASRPSRKAASVADNHRTASFASKQPHVADQPVPIRPARYGASSRRPPLA